MNGKFMIMLVKTFLPAAILSFSIHVIYYSCYLLFMLSTIHVINHVYFHVHNHHKSHHDRKGLKAINTSPTTLPPSPLHILLQQLFLHPFRLCILPQQSFHSAPLLL